MYFLFTTMLVLACVASCLVLAHSKELNELPSCTEEFSFQSTPSADAFLTSVLNPISVDDFFENHFQQKAASAQRPGKPTYYGPMASFDDVQYALEYGMSTNPNRRLKYGKDWKLAKRVFRDGEYWTGLYKAQSEEELGVEEAMSAVSSGFTVIMNGIQSCFPNVYQGAWQLETALGWHVNVNLYISPPGGAQGFEAHLDWMDGFIFQITGKKRWKVYEPALVSYPRPDMVHKPPMSFLEDAAQSTESDLVLKAGDFAYIPRGIVHQAHTSREDVASSGSSREEEGDGSPLYQQASMHLTFGLELAKDSSVEMLLHHFISKQPPAVFQTLADSLEALSSSSSSSPSSAPAAGSFVFESDNGKFSFQCTPSIGTVESSHSASGGIQSSASSVDAGTPAPVSCTERDIIHLLLSAMAGYISSNETAFLDLDLDMDLDMDLSTEKLRKAVGVTARTSALPALDPRVLLPQGLEVFSQAVRRLGVRQLLHFLLQKQMITATVTKTGSCAATDEVDVGSNKSEVLAETLYPASGSAQSYTTLGSDFSCRYIDSFFSKSFKTQGAGRLALQLQVPDQAEWEGLVLDTAEGAQKEKGQGRSYDRLALETFLAQDSWDRLDGILSDFVGQTLGAELLQNSHSEIDGDDEGKSRSARNKKRQNRRGTAAYRESEVYCEAWKSMMSTMEADKKIRKKAGHSALQNAGYQMNAS